MSGEARLTVLVTDHPWASLEPERLVFDSLGAELLLAGSGEEAELRELVVGADAILTCFARVSEAVVRAGERLRTIGRYGTGVDNIAVAAASERGVIVSNVPSYCEQEVAEHTLALMLALARRVVSFDRAVHAGDWSLGSGGPIQRLHGRTLGIVGLGQIGALLARQAGALGLRVLAHHPRRDAAEIEAAGAEPASLPELAAQSDFVSLHLPLTDQTRHLIDADFLRAMKPTAFLLNTARGGVVDQDALVQALREGWIAGAGVDVLTPERLPAEHPLLALPNAILTPHVAYYSEESLLELGRLAAVNVAAVLAGRRPASVVNPDVLDGERWRGLAGSTPQAGENA